MRDTCDGSSPEEQVVPKLHREDSNQQLAVVSGAGSVLGKHLLHDPGIEISLRAQRILRQQITGKLNGTAKVICEAVAGDRRAAGEQTADLTLAVIKFH